MKNAAYVIPNADSFLVVENHGKNSDGNTDTFVGLKTSFSGVELMGAYDETKAGSSKAKSTTSCSGTPSGRAIPQVTM